MNSSVKITVTGAAGNIGYAILFRIISGAMLGRDQSVALELFERPDSEQRLRSVLMELEDCAPPILREVQISTQLESAFGDADYVILIGARPRSKGMERKDLIAANGDIFAAQGRAINNNASRDARVLVVGNPANTNALIAAANAPDLSPTQFSCLMRLDHNRGVAALANKTQTTVDQITRMTIWGNHSTTQFPDLSYCKVGDRAATDLVDEQWLNETFIPEVQHRGARVIEARGASSAASAAHATISQMRDWVGEGTAKNDWTSLGVYSDGKRYGIESDLIYSFPATCGGGNHTVVDDLPINDFQRQRMDASMRELMEERDAVKHLLKPS